jgi:hypothetical protein
VSYWCPANSHCKCDEESREQCVHKEPHDLTTYCFQPRVCSGGTTCSLMVAEAHESRHLSCEQMTFLYNNEFDAFVAWLKAKKTPPKRKANV